MPQHDRRIMIRIEPDEQHQAVRAGITMSEDAVLSQHHPPGGSVMRQTTPRASVWRDGQPSGWAPTKRTGLMITNEERVDHRVGQRGGI